MNWTPLKLRKKEKKAKNQKFRQFKWFKAFQAKKKNSTALVRIIWIEKNFAVKKKNIGIQAEKLTSWQLRKSKDTKIISGTANIYLNIPTARHQYYLL